MSLQISIGAIGNLLDELPEFCRRVVLPTPVLTRAALERLRKRRTSALGFSAINAVRHLPGRRGRRGADPSGRPRSCRRASRAAWDGYASIVVLSDRDIDAD